MLDITAIILTYNEEIHIRRCLENVGKFAKRIIVVDCFSKDKTCEIAKEMGRKLYNMSGLPLSMLDSLIGLWRMRQLLPNGC